MTYDSKLGKDGQLVAHARIADSSGRVRSSKAQTMPEDYESILEQIERAAGGRTSRHGSSLGLLEGAPAKEPPRRARHRRVAVAPRRGDEDSGAADRRDGYKMIMERTTDARTTMGLFDGIGRQLLVIKWMMALLLAGSLVVLLLTLWIWARLP